MTTSAFKYTEALPTRMETLARSESYEEYLMRYRSRFDGYVLEILEEDQERGLRKHSRHVTLQTRSGEEYASTFVTLTYTKRMMRRWKKSGDYANGSYFPTDKTVLVRDLRESTIKNTIDDIIESLAVEEFFVKQQV